MTTLAPDRYKYVTTEQLQGAHEDTKKFLKELDTKFTQYIYQSKRVYIKNDQGDKQKDKTIEAEIDSLKDEIVTLIVSDAKSKLTVEESAQIHKHLSTLLYTLQTMVEKAGICYTEWKWAEQYDTLKIGRAHV